MLAPGRGRTKKGYFWAVARDDRAWGGTDPPAVAYTYAPGRGAVHALKLLDHYRGIVQCDAAYKTIAKRNGIPGRTKKPIKEARTIAALKPPFLNRLTIKTPYKAQRVE